MRTEFEANDPDVRAQVVIPCRDFGATLDYFTRTLGCRLHRIFPADDPREAEVSFNELTILLQRSDRDDNGSIRLVHDDPTATEDRESRLTAPNGTTIDMLHRAPRPLIPPVDQSLVISRIADSTEFGAGRAGMGYRDLIPDRQGGRFIASHIRIEEGGDIADYPHFHKIRFQLIFCYKGWVRVAYEDQGQPLLLEPGDCFLQPPGIRHQVLESSPGLEVIEIGCPAEHDTYHDTDMTLPDQRIDPDGKFGGQQFVHHVASTASWVPWRLPGWECRHTGIAEATDGLAGVRVVRSAAAADAELHAHDTEFLFFFVLDGSLIVTIDDRTEQLVAGDSIVIPGGQAHHLAAGSAATEVLEVSLPALV